MFKKISYTTCANTYKHFHKITSAETKERNLGFTCHCFCEQGLTGARRSNQQNALGDPATQFLEFLRLAQELDDLLQLFLGLVDAGHVGEAERVFAFLQIDRPNFTHNAANTSEFNRAEVNAYLQANEAPRLKPNFPEALEYLGEAYVIQGKYDLAKDQLATIAEIAEIIRQLDDYQTTIASAVISPSSQKRRSGQRAA